MNSQIFFNIKNEEICVKSTTGLPNKNAAEICISAKSPKLSSWLGVTTFLAIFAFFLQLHQLHIGLLVSVATVQLVMLLYRIHHKVISESLLVVSGIGVQTTTLFLSGKQQSRFIPWPRLMDIIIAETITMQQVFFYMAIMITTDGIPPDKKYEGVKLIPLFLNTWPRLDCLRQIYVNTREVLDPLLKSYDVS